MLIISEFFESNYEVIIFAYGLAFFVLGLAVIVQIRQSSRLELSRSLKWLAAFGIMHGLNEWGDLFIPLQATYLSPFWTIGLYVIQLILLALSFAALFEFGATTLMSIGRMTYLKGVSGILASAWAITSILLFALSYPNYHHAWRYTSMALSRYFIGFPGGLLAAYGLWAYTKKRIVPLDVPKIVRTFQVAEYSIAIYAVLSGLIPPPVNFFPGNLINTDTFTVFVGIPPWVFRTIIALTITIAITRALEIFELETNRRIEQLEQEKIIAAERERYARELHDGTIQKVYTAGLLVESAARIAEPETEIGKRLNRAVSILNDTIADLRQALTELHGYTSEKMPPLSELLKELIDDPHYKALLKVDLELDIPASKELSPRRTKHIIAIAAEGLANAVRHAQAQNVLVKAQDLGNKLQIIIKDDGVGLPETLKAGYGLSNIRDRTRLLNGTIECTSKQGTKITVTIPWIDED